MADCVLYDDDYAAAEQEEIKRIVRAMAIPSTQFKDMEKTYPEKMESFYDFCKRQDDLDRIDDEIVKEEAIFVEERKKWVADHQHLLTDIDKYFVERCKWETDFKENHFKHLYEEISAAKGIPRFWLRAMIANKRISKLVAETDKEALSFLIDIKSRRTEDLRGFELEFTFDDSNPYFKNKVLTKKYELKDENQSVSLKALGTKIEWHPGRDLQSGKSNGFFKFFNSYASLKTFSFNKQADELEGNIPTDYVIGTKFRDKLIPHAISWHKYSEAGDSDDDRNQSDED